MGDFILSQKEISWAWDKWNLGYSYFEIADALHCNFKTIERAFKRTYGDNRMRIKPVLVYEEVSE